MVIFGSVALFFPLFSLTSIKIEGVSRSLRIYCSFWVAGERARLAIIYVHHKPLSDGIFFYFLPLHCSEKGQMHNVCRLSVYVVLIGVESRMKQRIVCVTLSNTGRLE